MICVVGEMRGFAAAGLDIGRDFTARPAATAAAFRDDVRGVVVRHYNAPAFTHHDGGGRQPAPAAATR
ncbi:MAG: hypothetical protein AB7I23_18050 [Vicinamibacterales bacterium]